MNRFVILVQFLLFLDSNFGLLDHEFDVEVCMAACANVTELPVPNNIVLYTNGFYRPNLDQTENGPPLEILFAEVYWDCQEWIGPGKEFELNWFVSDDKFGKNKSLIKWQRKQGKYEKAFHSKRGLDNDIHISSIPIKKQLEKKLNKSGKQSAFISCSIRAISSGIGGQVGEWGTSEPVEIGVGLLYKPPSYQYMSFREKGGSYIDATVDMIRKEVIHIVSRRNTPSLLEFYAADQEQEGTNLLSMLYRLNYDLPWHKQPLLNAHLEEVKGMMDRGFSATKAHVGHREAEDTSLKENAETIQIEVMKSNSRDSKAKFDAQRSKTSLIQGKHEVQGLANDWLTGRFYVAYGVSEQSSAVASWSFIDKEFYHTPKGMVIESLLINPFANELYLLVAEQDHHKHSIVRVGLHPLDEAGGSLITQGFFDHANKTCDCLTADIEQPTSFCLDLRKLNTVGGVQYANTRSEIKIIFGTNLGNIYQSNIDGCHCKKLSAAVSTKGAVSAVSIDFEGIYFALEDGPLWFKNHEKKDPELIQDLYYPVKNNTFTMVHVADIKSFGTTWRPYPRTADCLRLPNRKPEIKKDAVVSHNEIIFNVDIQQKANFAHCNNVVRPAFFLSVRYRSIKSHGNGDWKKAEFGVSNGIPIAGLNSSTQYELTVAVLNEHGHSPRSEPFLFKTSVDPSVYKMLVVAGITVCSVLLILLIAISGYLIKRFRRIIQAHHFAGVLNKRGFNVLNIISAKDITVIENEILGTGGFGKVIKGIIKEPEKAEQRKVALKSLDPQVPKTNKASDVELDFFTEADALSRLQKSGIHPNVVELLGVCIDSDSPYLVMELMEINVRAFVTHIARGNTRITLREADALQIAFDTASGMEHIHKLGYLHRDLRACNVFLTSSNPMNFVAKVGDLGLARDISKLQTKCYKIPLNEVMPLCWMSPETLDCRSYTKASDVWSFGVFCWEMSTFGDVPYREFQGWGKFDDQVKEWVINQCGTPGKPCRFPKFHSMIMKPCWEFEPECRPTFSELAKALNEMLDQMREHDLHILQPIPAKSSVSSGYSSGSGQTFFSDHGSNSHDKLNSSSSGFTNSSTKSHNVPVKYTAVNAIPKALLLAQSADDTKEPIYIMEDLPLLGSIHEEPDQGIDTGSVPSVNSGHVMLNQGSGSSGYMSSCEKIGHKGSSEESLVDNQHDLETALDFNSQKNEDKEEARKIAPRAPKEEPNCWDTTYVSFG